MNFVIFDTGIIVAVIISLYRDIITATMIPVSNMTKFTHYMIGEINNEFSSVIIGTNKELVVCAES